MVCSYLPYFTLIGLFKNQSNLRFLAPQAWRDAPIQVKLYGKEHTRPTQTFRWSAKMVGMNPKCSKFGQICGFWRIRGDRFTYAYCELPSYPLHQSEWNLAHGIVNLWHALPCQTSRWSLVRIIPSVRDTANLTKFLTWGPTYSPPSLIRAKCGQWEWTFGMLFHVKFGIDRYIRCP